jgi:hypothetical protein
MLITELLQTLQFKPPKQLRRPLYTYKVAGIARMESYSIQTKDTNPNRMMPITDQPDLEPEINGSPENARNPYKRLQNQRTSSTNGSNEVQYVEMLYKDKAIPSWKSQLTVRALVVSLVLGTLFTVLLLKLRLTAGLIFTPAYMHPGLVGFSCIKAWVTIVERCGILGQPFTRQENTMIQVCVLAIIRVAVNGKFNVLSQNITLISTIYIHFLLHPSHGCV